MERITLFKMINLPESLYDWMDDVYTERDWEILSLSENGTIPKENFSQEEIQNLYSRGIINKLQCEDELKYTVAPFDVRMECMIQKEKELWNSFSKEKKAAIAKVMMNPETWLVQRLDALSKGLAPAEVVSPLENAIKAIEDAEGIITVLQCNCQAYLEKCTRDKSNVCIHVFSEDNIPLNSPLDRKICKILSKEEAIEVVKRTDRDGLVHSVFQGGHVGMCNCCSCCCYNLSNSDKYPIKDNLLKTPYRAKIDSQKCKKCKRCISQCPFGAIVADENGSISVNENLCWGCGVCRSVCNTGALSVYCR